MSIFRVLPNSRDDWYFVGDSITEQGRWHELFGPHACNRGLNGDTTERLLKRLDEVTEGHPARVYLMIGVNDLLHGDPVPQVVMRIRKIVQTIQEKSPSTMIYLEDIMPVRNKPRLLAQIKEVNHILSDVPGTVHVRLDGLCDATGALAANYTIDGIHLTGAGFLRWCELIEAAEDYQE